MSVDRILQLKLIADVQDIAGKMGAAEQDVGRVTKAFGTLKSFAMPAMLSLGGSITSNVVGALGDAVTRAGELRDELVQLDSLSVSLGIDQGQARGVLDALTSEAQSLGFGDEVAIADMFAEALAVTEDVDKSIALVRASFDQARASGEDLGEAADTAFDAIIGGGDEAEEKLGVFGETIDERLTSFQDKYGNFAEDFALTDQGEWETINAEFDGYLMDLGTMVDEFVLDFKSGLVDGLKAWDDNLNVWLPLIGEKLGEWAQDTKDAIKRAFDGMVDSIRGPLNDVLGALESALNWIGGAFFGALEGIRSSLNPIAFIGDQIPDDPIVWGGISVPRLASGGIVTAPTLAMIGEGRHDEAVIPLDGRNLGASYTVNVQAGASSPADVGRAVVDAIAAFERRAGASWRS